MQSDNKPKQTLAIIYLIEIECGRSKDRTDVISTTLQVEQLQIWIKFIPMQHSKTQKFNTSSQNSFIEGYDWSLCYDVN